MSYKWTPHGTHELEFEGNAALRVGRVVAGDLYTYEDGTSSSPAWVKNLCSAGECVYIFPDSSCTPGTAIRLQPNDKAEFVNGKWQLVAAITATSKWQVIPSTHYGFQISYTDGVDLVSRNHRSVKGIKAVYAELGGTQTGMWIRNDATGKEQLIIEQLHQNPMTDVLLNAGETAEFKVGTGWFKQTSVGATGTYVAYFPVNGYSYLDPVERKPINEVKFNSDKTGGCTCGVWASPDGGLHSDWCDVKN